MDPRRLWAGYGLLGLSGVFWSSIFAVPLLGLPAGPSWWLAGGLWVANYVAFLAALWVLGRPAYEAIKARGMAWFRRWTRRGE